MIRRQVWFQVPTKRISGSIPRHQISTHPPELLPAAPHRSLQSAILRDSAAARTEGGRLFTGVHWHATNPGFPKHSRREAPITTFHGSRWAAVNASGSSRGHFAPRGDQSL